MPTLVLSGELDPVTPPAWGEQVAKTLANSKHIVMPGTGHTAGGTGCGQRIIRNFIDKGTARRPRHALHRQGQAARRSSCRPPAPIPAAKPAAPKPAGQQKGEGR